MADSKNTNINRDGMSTSDMPPAYNHEEGSASDGTSSLRRPKSSESNSFSSKLKLIIPATPNTYAVIQVLVLYTLKIIGLTITVANPPICQTLRHFQSR
ncbi:hypothetical protein IFR04_009126 [Cadophora malorum]|uniref:Uncharacterized protein n=1 Tax=Cadophora malorum TaxID=108018 RepID=A0A8H7TDP4_9HELO|nr:hypothetical protein IFR04_009126 [Cadophora malorum]